MNRLIERELTEKTRELRAVLADCEDRIPRVRANLDSVSGANPYTGAVFVQLALLITEYNTLQALQAEIDS